MLSALDRFDEKGPAERWPVKSLLYQPECDVCGEEVDPRLLREWNDQNACKYCIADMNEENTEEATIHVHAID